MAIELTTVQRISEEIGVECSTSLQAAVLPYIRAVSQSVERMCGRRFAYKAEAVETKAGRDSPHLWLRRSPIRSIAKLEFVDLDGNELSDVGLEGVTVEDIDDETGFGMTGLIYRASGFVKSSWSVNSATRPAMLGTERQNYRVTYAGGWVTPQQAADVDSINLPRDLPYDIEEAVVLEVVARYRKRGRDVDIRSERLLDGSVTYQSTTSKAFGINDVSVGMLMPYVIPAGGYS